MCYYLLSCTKYVDDIERDKIMKLIFEQYLRFNEFARALIVALLMNDQQLVLRTFKECKEKYALFAS